MKNTAKKKITKGDRGYIRDQKVKRTLITFVLFLIPIVIFVTGLIQTKTRLNLFTFVAIMGCLPACKSAVGMIMMFLQKPMSDEVYEKASQAAGDGMMLYELCFTAYEKTTPVDCLYLCGSNVVGYSSSPKADPAFLEKHLKDVLKKGGRSRDVKIFRDLKPFLDRVRTLESHKDPGDPKFQALEEKNKEVRAVLLGVAL
ncbi:MAG: hypothetical protein SOZ59_00925 [Candidatus Limivivens sp.]|nr:hypothetical protein [Candidatus Limivivens sp.]